MVYRNDIGAYGRHGSNLREASLYCIKKKIGWEYHLAFRNGKREYKWRVMTELDTFFSLVYHITSKVILWLLATNMNVVKLAAAASYPFSCPISFSIEEVTFITKSFNNCKRVEVLL